MTDAADTVSWGSATHVGRVRQGNEDAAAVAWPVVVVADGMGGHAAGEVASEIAVRTIAELGAAGVGVAGLGADGAGAVGVRELTARVALANERVLDSVRRHPEQDGMGTTVTGLALTVEDGVPSWLVFNVGDSRVYRLLDGDLQQVTVDHSEVAELVAEGLLTPEAARRHPARNMITRVVGRDPGPEVDTWLLPARAGERFLVCSDGVTNELSDDDLARLLAEAGDARVAERAERC